MTYAVEYTDTFGGDANYCWVRRASIPAPPWKRLKEWASVNYQRQVIRRAKAAVGITGLRGKTERYGDGYTFRPYRCATVMFVNWED